MWQRLILALIVIISCGCGRTSPRGGASAARFEGTLRIEAPGWDGARSLTLFEVKGSRARWDMTAASSDSSGHRDLRRKRFLDVCSLYFRRKSSSSWTTSDERGHLIIRRARPRIRARARRGPPGRLHRSARATPLGNRAIGFAPATARACSTLCATQTILPLPLEVALPQLLTRAPFLVALEAQGRLVLAATTTSDADAGPGIPRRLLGAVAIEASPVDDSRFVVPDLPVTGPSRTSRPALR